MADLNKTSKGILGEASKKIGTYSESTGGGTPLAKGEKLKDHPEAKRVSQPRDEDGQFTYNSVNGKELKYGPSRGTTVPPFLRGLELTFCEKGTKLKTSDGEILIMTVDMSVEQMVANCKKYMEDENGFAGMGEGSSIVKKGRKSKEEKEASPGIIGKADTSKFAESTKKAMEEGAAKVEGTNAPINSASLATGKDMPDDTLNPDGSTTRNTDERYWESIKSFFEKPTGSGEGTPTASEESEEKTPVTPSGAPAPEKTEAEKASDMFGVDVTDSKEEKKEPEMSLAEKAKTPEGLKQIYDENKDKIDSKVDAYNKSHPGKPITYKTILLMIQSGKLTKI